VIEARRGSGSIAGLLACALCWLGGAGSALAEPGVADQPAYDRTGFHLGAGGVYAFEDMSYDIDSLGVGVAFPGGNFDPRFDDSAGVDVLIGYRLHSRIDFEFQYEWLEGFDSTQGDPTLELDTHMLAVNARGFLLTERWQPYALVGAGALIVNTEIVDSAFKKPFDIDVGAMFRFGGGLDFYATRHWVLGVEGAYVLPLGDVKDANYGTLGLRFHYRF